MRELGIRKARTEGVRRQDSMPFRHGRKNLYIIEIFPHGEWKHVPVHGNFRTAASVVKAGISLRLLKGSGELGIRKAGIEGVRHQESRDWCS